MGKVGSDRDIEPHGRQLVCLREDFACCPLHLELRAVDDQHMIRRHSFLHEMGDQHDGDPFRAVQLMDGIHDFLASQRVEHRRRFVQDDAVRMHREYTGDGDPLLLSAGEHRR